MALLRLLWHADRLGVRNSRLLAAASSSVRVATSPTPQILSLYSEFEPREQSGKYRSYREVLASVVRDFARELRFEVTEAETAGLADSIGNWQPFADTVPALRRLHSRYKLAIVSNIDDDLFAHSARKLRVPFHCVVTAQQAQSYKPSRQEFRTAAGKDCVPRDRGFCTWPRACTTMLGLLTYLGLRPCG